MREEEVDKILKPKGKSGSLILIFMIFIGIAIVCISVPFYMKYEGTKDPQNFLEMVSKGEEKEGEYVELKIAYLPVLLAVDPEENSNYYYLADEEERIYIAKISDKTLEYLNSNCDEATGKLTLDYSLKGFTYNMDIQLQQIILRDMGQMYEEQELTLDNFSEYFGRVYIDENQFPISDRTLTLYKIVALIGVFFLILAVGFILPGIVKARKLSRNHELTEELRMELAHMTETPYAGYKLYLTDKYIISGMTVIRYEDVIWGYVQVLSRYGIKTGRDLIVYTKDKKRHTVLSVSPKSTAPDVVLDDLRNKIPQMRVGYDKENKKFFENYKKEN